MEWEAFDSDEIEEYEKFWKPSAEAHRIWEQDHLLEDKCILLADNDANNVNLVKNMLERKKAKIIIAENGKKLWICSLKAHSFISMQY